MEEKETQSHEKEEEIQIQKIKIAYIINDMQLHAGPEYVWIRQYIYLRYFESLFFLLQSSQ